MQQQLQKINENNNFYYPLTSRPKMEVKIHNTHFLLNSLVCAQGVLRMPLSWLDCTSKIFGNTILVFHFLLTKINVRIYLTKKVALLLKSE